MGNDCFDGALSEYDILVISIDKNERKIKRTSAEYECFEVCFDAWTDYIQNSLKNLITSGKGQSNAKGGKKLTANQ